jgi:hypothetical protein
LGLGGGGGYGTSGGAAGAPGGRGGNLSKPGGAALAESLDRPAGAKALPPVVMKQTTEKPTPGGKPIGELARVEEKSQEDIAKLAANPEKPQPRAMRAVVPTIPSPTTPAPATPAPTTEPPAPAPAATAPGAAAPAAGPVATPKAEADKKVVTREQAGKAAKGGEVAGSSASRSSARPIAPSASEGDESGDKSDPKSIKRRGDAQNGAKAAAEASLRYAGDGVTPEAPAAIYFNPRLIADDNGRATIEFTLPPVKSEYRLLIDALGNGRVGSLQKVIECREPAK